MVVYAKQPANPNRTITPCCAGSVWRGLGLARHWLITPQWALKDRRPLDCLLTEVESRVVLELIGQIGHGIAI
ncbi:antitoxin Xre/MbcA/ParS toxin-binding domain-containing protein [Pseudomonas putida]|uniref:antitoxin Xre/MbcA/ParS toxin-binding domain-containing protein n=1 Tax=Pseudomonas putida TaxID=303 RepID=UPI003905FDAF